MAGLSFTPVTSQKNIPQFSYNLGGSVDDGEDALSPTDIPEQSDFKNYFNHFSADAGAYIGPAADAGLYAGFAWSKTHDSPELIDGQDGADVNYSYSVEAGVKTGFSTDGPLAFVQGTYSYSHQDQPWVEGSTATFDIYDDSDNIIGQETNTTSGFRSSLGPTTELDASIYADTGGYVSLYGQAGYEFFSEGGISLEGRGAAGYNSDDAAFGCLAGSASMQIGLSSFDAYTNLTHCKTGANGADKSADLGITGYMELPNGSTIPVDFGVTQDLSGDSGTTGYLNFYQNNF